MSHQAHQMKAFAHQIEDESRIRTKSVYLSQSNGTKGTEIPEFILWVGPDGLFISADLRGIVSDELQVRISGTRLILYGYLQSDVPPETGGIRQANVVPVTFSQTLDLPCEVDAEPVEVQNENGLISISLKRKKSQRYDDHAEQRFFADNGSKSNGLKDAIAMLETLDRYL